MSPDGTTNQSQELLANAQNLLDPFEVRVLAVLAEKEALTPDSYPLSLNALTNGCNQLSSRDPVMSISDSTVQDVLHRLVQRKLVAEVSQAGARVSKYEHRMRIKWTLEQDKLAILTMLMLRGVQTAGEIRSRVGRMHEFASVGEVEIGLQFLIDKYPPLVGRIARAPGAKEARYAHLLCGEEILERQELMSGSVADTTGNSSRVDRVEQLEQEVSRLQDAVASLTQQFENFKKQFE
jgi:uncharacterized protein YceH (UPF0502 family)